MTQQPFTDGTGSLSCACALRLRTLVHDTRTPLNVIVALAELLAAGQPGPLTVKQTQHIESIRTAARGITEILRLAGTTVQPAPAPEHEAELSERS